MRNGRVVGRINGWKYSWWSHTDRNWHKNRMKKSGQARLVYVKDTNHNIPTMWKWVRGDQCYVRTQRYRHLYLCGWADSECNYCPILVQLLPTKRPVNGRRGHITNRDRKSDVSHLCVLIAVCHSNLDDTLNEQSYVANYERVGAYWGRH